MVLDGQSLDRLDVAVGGASTRALDARRHADRHRAPWQARRIEAEAIRRLEQRHRAQERAEEHAREQATQDEQSGARHARAQRERAYEYNCKRSDAGHGDAERARNDD
jgi:flagellar export protein FliJ